MITLTRTSLVEVCVNPDKIAFMFIGKGKIRNEPYTVITFDRDFGIQVRESIEEITQLIVNQSN